ncbi:MAG: LacI family DNA-binding transcriptional regulator [Dermatophilaceae bacterium]
MTTSGHGTRPATIYSVAQRAGVSIATVSRVLQGTGATSPQTRAKVLQAVEDLEYVPRQSARSLAVQRHEAHGLVVPDLAGPYYSELLMGYESAAAEFGKSVILVVTHLREDPTRAVRDLSSRVDGLTLAQSTIPDGAARALSRRTPVVLLARPPVVGCDAVSAENIQSARALTEHLLDHGRRRLFFVGDPDGSPDVQERYRGFTAALSAADASAVGPAIRVDFRERSGAEVAAQVLEHVDGPDALVCANDELALSTMKALQRAGVKVPDDIAIVGWDDVMTARYVSPGLTTVRQPLYELGRLAATRLHERIAGAPTAPELRILPTELVLRSSCGCPEKDDRDVPWVTS